MDLDSFNNELWKLIGSSKLPISTAKLILQNAVLQLEILRLNAVQNKNQDNGEKAEE